MYFSMFHVKHFVSRVTDGPFADFLFDCFEVDPKISGGVVDVVFCLQNIHARTRKRRRCMRRPQSLDERLNYGFKCSLNI